jgi:hypothetical protein
MNISRLILRTLGVAASFGWIASGVASQQPRFAEVGEPAPATTSNVIGSGDYDGDGDVDVYSTSGVALNDGGGSFTPGPKFPDVVVRWAAGSGVGSTTYAFGDVNGDGFADVVMGRLFATFELPATLQLYLAPGAGGDFSEAAGAFSGFAPFTSVQSIAGADVDLDGDLDVSVAGTRTSGSEWLLLKSDGSGGLSSAPASEWTPTPMTGYFVFGDFDADGDLDLAGHGGAGAAAGYYNRNNGGGGVFEDAFLFLPSTPVVKRLLVGDLNGDGYADLFHALWQNAALGGPDGLLTGPPFATWSPALIGAIEAADVDADGDADLFYNRTTPLGGGNPPPELGLELRIRDGGTYAPPVVLTHLPASSSSAQPQLYEFTVADFDGDGLCDVVACSQRGWPSVLINRGVAGFVPLPKPMPHGVYALAAPPADADHDGDVDLLATWVDPLVPAARDMRLLLNDGRGAFSGASAAPPAFAASDVPSPFLGPDPASAWGDFDSDGDEDLYFAQHPYAYWLSDGAVARNDGQSFTFVPRTGPHGDSWASVVGDFDGDGDLDVVEARRNQSGSDPLGKAALVRNITVPGGPIDFAPPVLFGGLFDAHDVAAFDAEGDGDLDLVFGALPTQTIGGHVRFFLNNGSATFAVASAFSGVSATFVGADDLDGDGDMDVVLDGQTRLRQGSFYVAGPTMVSPPLTRFRFIDVDLDGDRDLVDGDGYWRSNLGGGAFAAPESIVTRRPSYTSLDNGYAYYPGSPPHAADLDGDGDVDFVVPGVRTPVAVYWNVTRHAGARGALRLGRSAVISVYGAAGEPWILGLAASFIEPPLALPPFGTLHLDPASLLIFASGTLPAGGRFDIFGAVPAGPPSLAGVVVPWQGVVGTKFANAFGTPLIP